MKMVITGFEPFGNDLLNSSGELIKCIKTYDGDNNILKAILLPVSFNRVGIEVRNILSCINPDVLIMFGQSSSTKEIRLERVALNFMDAKKTDNDGYIPDEEKIEIDGENAYFCNMPLKVIEKSLKGKNIGCKISNNAGTYVCNCAYYNALHYIYKCHKDTKVLFVHLPLLYEQKNIHTNNYYITKEELVRILKDLIHIINSQHHNYDTENIRL